MLLFAASISMSVFFAFIFSKVSNFCVYNILNFAFSSERARDSRAKHQRKKTLGIVPNSHLLIELVKFTFQDYVLVFFMFKFRSTIFSQSFQGHFDCLEIILQLTSNKVTK